MCRSILRTIYIKRLITSKYILVSYYDVIRGSYLQKRTIIGALRE